MQELEAGLLHGFQDWPDDEVPKRAAGVYTVWDGDRLLYVGMSGRAMTAEDLDVSPNGRVVAKGLWTRLNAHAAGRRSGDQFCVYVCDRFVVPALTPSQQQQLAAGGLSLDDLTRGFIRHRLAYRFVVTADGTEAARLEAEVRRGGALGGTAVSESPGAILELTTVRLARDFAAGLMVADARRPRWGAYQPGIGPHTEVQTVALVLAELRREDPALYGAVQTGVAYPNSLRQKCDLLIAPRGGRSWAVEVKMLRLMGDNGKPNDNMLMHILSPYPSHRSALTDCQKLVGSGFSGSLGVLIYGYDYDALPLEPAVEAFEQLAEHRVRLGPRQAASFEGLIHPVHRRGGVFAWEVDR